MISYQLNKEKNILEIVFKGMISPEEIFDLMLQINSNEELPRVLNVIIDVRGADFIFEPTAIQNIVKANFRMNRSFNRIRNALLANNPDDTTLTLFHQYVRDSQNYLVRIFNDRDLAEKWLLSNK
jgi:hypothetical protein